jgi:pyridoxamine 5'-phosphate oxidase family protein
VSVLSNAELEYLAEGKLGRLATIGADGFPHIVPLGWTYNAALDTIDVGGRDFAATQKFRNVQRDPSVALVVDDVLPPWRPRCVMIRGHGSALHEAIGPDGGPTGPIIRITPVRVVSFGLSTS